MHPNHKKWLWGIGLAAGVLFILAVILVWRPRASEANDTDNMLQEGATDDGVAEVQTIQPRNNLPTMVVVQEPADVEAFYRADLDSQAPGSIQTVTKGIGDPVRKGEVLIQVDAPDRVQDLEEKESVVEQRKQELNISQAQAKIASNMVDVAQEVIRQRLSEVNVADAEKDYRKDIWNRYIDLGQRGVVTPDVVVEKRKGYLVAEAGAVSARVAVQKAYAELKAEKAKLEEAEADIKLREARIQVARKDRDRARALLDYAKIIAPFDGIMIRRNVDPGDFVQNASTAHTQPLVSVVRTDIMTVVMKVPDTYASFVTKDTDAVIQLPGRLLKGKVTRFSPSIHQKDRTMRIEVDLYNGSRKDYDRFILKGLSSFLPSVGNPDAVRAALLLNAGRSAWGDNMKGSMDPFPAYPENLVNASGEGSQRLLPRMYGYMKLFLKDFQGAYLIPSRAVFSVGGKNYILVVQDGRAQRVPVKVQVNDGRLAKVTMLIRENLDIGEAEVPKELTGKEQIVIGGQTEITEGQKVHPSAIAQWPNHLNDWAKNQRP